MAGARPHQPSEPDSEGSETQLELATYFSHGDQEGLKHLKDLFKLINAESRTLNPTARQRYAAPVIGIAMSQVRSVQQHRERNAQELIRVNESYPTGHPSLLVAVERYLKAQRQLSNLEEQLAHQLTQSALHAAALGHAAHISDHGSVDSGIVVPASPVKRIHIHDVLEGSQSSRISTEPGCHEPVLDTAMHSHSESLTSTYGDLISFENELTRESETAKKNEVAKKNESVEEKPQGPGIPSVWYDPVKLEEFRTLFNKTGDNPESMALVPNCDPDVHNNQKKPELTIPAGSAAPSMPQAPVYCVPQTCRTAAPNDKPEVMVPNEDLVDRLFDNEQLRVQAIRTYAGQNRTISPIFRYGIRYCPKLRLPLRPEQEKSDYECRTVIISDLSIGSQLRDVLAVVRGGKVLRATIVQLNGIGGGGAVAMVQFANWRHAHAYNEEAKAQEILVNGRKCSVALANTPSYPMSPASTKALEEGSTRCIEIKEAPMKELGDFVAALRRWFLRPEDVLEDAMLDLGKKRIMLHFRDLDFATNVFRMVKNSEFRFPTLRNTIGFLADPCAEPLETLDMPKATKDESISLMGVIGSPSWDIQSAYPSLGQDEERDADHAPDHESGDSTTRPVAPVLVGSLPTLDVAGDDEWIFTEEEYQELRGYKEFLRDPNAWSRNSRYWLGRTRKDLKPRV